MLIELASATISLPEKTLLSNVNFHIDEGEFVYIIGKVGSGKSSLLKTLYGELPTEGEKAEILGHDLTRLKRKHLPTLRKRLGIVFQDFQLLTDRTVNENLNFVLRATGWKKKKEREARIHEVLCEVGLHEKGNHYPHELSGGEQQRIAIARALLNSPEIILADEPTGNLDMETGNKIVELLHALCQRGTAVVMITHNLNLLQAHPGIVYECADGRVTEITQECNNPVAFN